MLLALVRCRSQKKIHGLREQDRGLRQHGEKSRVPRLARPKRCYQRYRRPLRLHLLEDSSDQAEGRVRPAVLAVPWVLQSIDMQSLRLGLPAAEARKLAILERRKKVHRMGAPPLVQLHKQVRVQFEVAELSFPSRFLVCEDVPDSREVVCHNFGVVLLAKCKNFLRQKRQVRASAPHALDVPQCRRVVDAQVDSLVSK
jgi:hypothetical protein